ncbi:hypothetical protein ES708_23112 [subsurface metagenome]
MEAKDTVIHLDKAIDTYSSYRKALEAQAEISFKAGIEFAEMAIQHQLLEVVEASKKAGIREVVEKVSRIHSSTSDLKEIEKRIVAILNEYHKTL